MEKVKICSKCGYGIPVWSNVCLRCNKPDLSSIKSNDTINSTLKNTEQKEQQTTNMKVSTKQQTISRTRKGTAKKSSWAGRTIKIKSRAKGEL